MASQGTSLQLFQDGYDLLAPRGLSSFPMLGRFLTQQKSVVGELQTCPVLSGPCSADLQPLPYPAGYSGPKQQRSPV